MQFSYNTEFADTNKKEKSNGFANQYTQKHLKSQ